MMAINGMRSFFVGARTGWLGTLSETKLYLAVESYPRTVIFFTKSQTTFEFDDTDISLSSTKFNFFSNTF